MIRLEKEKNIYILILENKPVNALSQELISELLLLTKEISSDKEVKGLIISSSLKDFCAGADLKERASMSNEESINTVYAIKMLFESIYNLPFPTLSLIKGACLGGGLELALSCDFRFGAMDSFYGLPETSLGIIPGAGGTQLLPRLIGLSNAKYMIYSSKNINANRAVEYGLIDKLIQHNIKNKSLESKYEDNESEESESEENLIEDSNHIWENKEKDSKVIEFDVKDNELKVSKQMKLII